MGNWRTVEIHGTCPPDQLGALREACADNDAHGGSLGWHCLMASEGLAGLGDWPAERILAHGNLAERDYTVEDVRAQLEELAKVAPGLDVKVHCGDDWEKPNCVATVTLRDGKAVTGPAEVVEVTGATDDQVMGRLFKTMTRRR